MVKPEPSRHTGDANDDGMLTVIDASSRDRFRRQITLAGFQPISQSTAVYPLFIMSSQEYKVGQKVKYTA
ncbi:hypothetical protein FRC12_024131, partial [Ceratobasidium sp. 428]